MTSGFIVKRTLHPLLFFQISTFLKGDLRLQEHQQCPQSLPIDSRETRNSEAQARSRIGKMNSTESVSVIEKPWQEKNHMHLKIFEVAIGASHPRVIDSGAGVRSLRSVPCRSEPA